MNTGQAWGGVCSLGHNYRFVYININNRFILFYLPYSKSVIIGIYKPNRDIELDFLNHINLCAKLFIRESQDKPLYLCVFIEKLNATGTCNITSETRHSSSVMKSYYNLKFYIMYFTSNGFLLCSKL